MEINEESEGTPRPSHTVTAGSMCVIISMAGMSSLTVQGSFSYGDEYSISVMYCQKESETEKSLTKRIFDSIMISIHRSVMHRSSMYGTI